MAQVDQPAGRLRRQQDEFSGGEVPAAECDTGGPLAVVEPAEGDVGSVEGARDGVAGTVEYRTLERQDAVDLGPIEAARALAGEPVVGEHVAAHAQRRAVERDARAGEVGAAHEQRTADRRAAKADQPGAGAAAERHGAVDRGVGNGELGKLAAGERQPSQVRAEEADLPVECAAVQGYRCIDVGEFHLQHAFDQSSGEP